MSVDKEKVKAAVQESFEDSDNMLKMIQEIKDWDKDLKLRVLASKCKMSNRERMWDIFSEEVTRHISEYTLIQYKDFPEDQVTSWDETQLRNQIEKYLNRMKNGNKRGELDANMDLIKIAHYAQMIWSKRMGFEDAFLEVLAERETNNE